MRRRTIKCDRSRILPAGKNIDKEGKPDIIGQNFGREEISVIAIVRMLSEEQGKKMRDFVAAHKKATRIWDHIVEHKDELQAAIEGKGCLLYLTRLAKKARRGDLSLFVHMSEPNELADFIANHLSKIEGITSIWIIDLFKPVFYPLPKDTRRHKRFAITLNSIPQLTSEVYESLGSSALPEGLIKTYLGYTFSSFGESVQFSLLVEHNEAVESYPADVIAQIPGVKRTHLYPIEMTKPLVSYEEWKEYSARHGIVTSWDDEHMMAQLEDWQKSGLPAE
jgi:hypothetical protein